MTESQRNNEARIMTFYSGWIEIQGNKEKEDAFLQKYLDYSPESLEILSQGKQEDVVDAIKVLLSIPIPQFIDAINHTYMLLSKDVFQYSKLEDATDTICTILEFEEHRLSYEEAGKRLTHSSQQNACIKYGENHAKTAAMLSLVLIGREPDNKRFGGLIELDEAGYIKSDESCKTSQEGVFCAGDTREKKLNQLVTATADGAVAASAAIDYLNNK